MLQDYSLLFVQPKATLTFPLGVVSLEGKEEVEVKRSLSINGLLTSPVLNGLCTAQYKEEDLKLRYCYKVMYFDRMNSV